MSNYYKTLHVFYGSDDPTAVMLSNPAAAPFEIDGVRCASVDGFISAILYPPSDPRHAQGLTLAGLPAKRLRAEAARLQVWWKDRVLPFDSGAQEALIERAIRAKFEQNRAFMSALRGTGDLRLYQERKEPYSARTILRHEVFCDILMRLRDGKLPRWPRGTHEEPLEIIVQPRGTRFVSWIEDSHGHAYWRGEAGTAHEAAIQTVGLFIAAHDRMWFTTRLLPA